MLAIGAIGLGLALGLAVGGSFRGLYSFRLRFEWLALSLFVIQGIARGRFFGLVQPSAEGLTIWTVSSVLLAVALLANWRLPGLLVMTVGLILNLIVVTANRGMPISPESARGVNVAALASSLDSTLGFYHMVGPGSLAQWLGDAMPGWLLGHWVFASAGDVLLAVGVIATIICSMLGDENVTPGMEDSGRPS
jgi:hypothetical protein